MSGSYDVSRVRRTLSSAIVLLAVASCSKTPVSQPSSGAAPAVAAKNSTSHETAPVQAEARPAFLDLPERAVPGRVFIVAIDGGNWEVFDPVMRAGLMPNLARLIQSGSRATLESMDPTASAIVWTTIATGKKPKQHGVHGFVVQTDDGRTVPVSSTLRRVQALWNIASEAGVSVGFLSWWVTWPAEPVRGFLCSDYTWPLRKDKDGFATGSVSRLDIPDRTYPPELMRDLDRFIKTEERLAPGELAALGLDALPRIEDYAVRDILLKDISVGNMAAYLLDKHKPSLVAVYFDGFDAFCHIFWPQYGAYLKARESDRAGGIARLPAQVQSLGRVMDAHLARVDLYLGAIMKQAAANDVVLVISDHGYGDNPSLQPIQRTYKDWIKPPHWHTKRGILVAAGGPIRQGTEGVVASVLDVTPTVLALLGLPVGRDMDGKVLSDLLTPEFLNAHPVQTVETYDLKPRVAKPVESAYDAGMKERLKALGYIEDEPEK